MTDTLECSPYLNKVIRSHRQARRDTISNWEANYGHVPVECLTQRVQATEAQQALVQAERIRDDLVSKLEDIEAVVKTQEFSALFEELSGDLDGTIANFVHTMNKVYEAMSDAGVPAQRRG